MPQNTQFNPVHLTLHSFHQDKGVPTLGKFDNLVFTRGPEGEITCTVGHGVQITQPNQRVAIANDSFATRYLSNVIKAAYPLGLSNAGNTRELQAALQGETELLAKVLQYMEETGVNNVVDLGVDLQDHTPCIFTVQSGEGGRQFFCREATDGLSQPWQLNELSPSTPFEYVLEPPSREQVGFKVMALMFSLPIVEGKLHGSEIS